MTDLARRQLHAVRSAPHVRGARGRGERVRVENPKQNGASRVVLYGESGQVLGEYLPDGTPLQEYVWVDALPVAVLSKGGPYPIEPDHLGTPRRAISSEHDRAIWSWDLQGSAFGTQAANEDPDQDATPFTLNLRFPGQQLDPATGLHYNYFRDYEPATGRYVESDPIGLSGGFATYGYVSAQPMLLTDPLGLCADDCCSDVSWPKVEGGRLGGTVRCCKGKEVMCVNPNICDGLSADACQIKQRCIKRHEQFHLDT